MAIHRTTTHPGPRFRCPVCGYEVVVSGSTLTVVSIGDSEARHYSQAEAERLPEVWRRGLVDVDLSLD